MMIARLRRWWSGDPWDRQVWDIPEHQRMDWVLRNAETHGALSAVESDSAGALSVAGDKPIGFEAEWK